MKDTQTNKIRTTIWNAAQTHKKRYANKEDTQTQRETKMITTIWRAHTQRN